MLPRARLRHDSLLAEAAGEDGLPEGVVELVRPGVQQILALEVEALARGEALGERERRRSPGVRAAELAQLGPVGLVGVRGLPRGGELVERRDQGLGHVAPAVVTEGAVHRRAAST